MRFVDDKAWHRVSILLLILSIALLPWHPYVSCNISGWLGVLGAISALSAGLLETFLVPYKRWRFIVFGGGGYVLFLCSSAMIH